MHLKESKHGPYKYSQKHSLLAFGDGFQLSYIRPQSRSIATSLFAAFWQSYLSWLNSSAGKGEAKHTCNKWTSGVANVEDLERQMLIFDDNQDTNHFCPFFAISLDFP